MSYGADIDRAFLLIGCGVLVLYVAWIRPHWLGLHWFDGLYRASRFGAVVIGITTVLFGVWKLDVIPSDMKGLIAVVWTAVVVFAAAYDLPESRERKR